MHRLLYLGQLLRQGPDALCALLRADRQHCACLLEALVWVFDWAGSSVALPHPAGSWQPWHDFICGHPSRFKSLVKRVVRLQQCQHVAIVALDGLYRGLQGSKVAAGAPDLAGCSEACLPCRRAFLVECLGRDTQPGAMVTGRRPSSWATGASAQDVAEFTPLPADSAESWGTYRADGPLPAEGHAQAPPVPICRHALDAVPEVPSETICRPLLDCLLSAEDHDGSVLWEYVEDNVAPLEVLRHTVDLWPTQASAQPWAAEAARDLASCVALGPCVNL